MRIPRRRTTRETQVDLTLTHPGSGAFRMDLPCGFLAHMLELLAFHGRFDLEGSARGDLQVDPHHLTEDLGIVLGEVLGELARSGRITLHVALLAADNGHHAAEAVFKGLGRALRQALSPSEGPASSKDVTP